MICKLCEEKFIELETRIKYLELDPSLYKGNISIKIQDIYKRLSLIELRLESLYEIKRCLVEYDFMEEE